MVESVQNAILPDCWFLISSKAVVEPYCRKLDRYLSSAKSNGKPLRESDCPINLGHNLEETCRFASSDEMLAAIFLERGSSVEAAQEKVWRSKILGG